MKKTFSKLFISFILASNIIYSYGCSTNSLSQISPDGNIESTEASDIEFKDISSEKIAQFNEYISRGMKGNIAQSGSISTYPSAEPSLMPSVAPSAMASAMPTPQASASASYSSGDSSNSSPDIEARPSISYSPTPYYSSYPTYNYPYPIPTYSSYPSPTSFFYGNFEDYVVVSSQEAKKSGAVGSYLEIVNKTINPIISKLSKDARLISGFGITDGKGVTKTSKPIPSAIPTPSSTAYPMQTPEPYHYEPFYNWQFTYISSSKKEVYSILVSSSETLILKQKWGLRQISTSNIKIDSTEAVKIVKKVVEDKDSRYAPTPMPTYVPIPYPYSYDDWEFVYSFDDYLEVTNTLEQIEGKVFWYINFSIPYDRQITTSDNGEMYWYTSGRATVNANTGELVYLERITRYKTSPIPTVSPYPYYSPTATPYPSAPNDISESQT